MSVQLTPEEEQLLITTLVAGEAVYDAFMRPYELRTLQQHGFVEDIFAADLSRPFVYVVTDKGKEYLRGNSS